MRYILIVLAAMALYTSVQAQNVGIGNTNPQHPLSVGTVTTDNQLVNLRSYSDIGASWKGGGAFGYTGATVILGELNGKAHIGGHNSTLSAWDDLFINGYGGNVGIGVASISGVKFEVGGTSKFHGEMDLTGYKLINVATPTAGTDGVNKDYVDNAITGNDDWDKTGNSIYPKSYATTNVGIGLPDPVGLLHVAGIHGNGIMQDGNDRPSVGITGVYPQLVLMSGSSGNASHGATIMIGGYDSGTSGAHKHWSIGTAGEGSTFLDIGYYAGTDLNPHAGIRNYASTTLMTILSDGNVGISNTAPIYKLDVNGDVRSMGKFLGRYFLFDTRSVNSGPDEFNNEMALEFKERSAIGAPGASTYGGLMTIAPWGDNSGGYHHQLFFNDEGIAYRTGLPNNSSWNIWGQLLTTLGGTANYVPKFNGSGSLTNSSIFDNGNVGIGINPPSAPLHLYTSSGDAFRLESTSGEADIRFVNGTVDWEVGVNNSGNGTSGNQFFAYQGGYRFTVQAGTGNVGIGTSTPAAGLHMYQDKYTLYGPNSSWSAYLQVGGNGRVTSYASVAATNGNLHLDAADGSYATYVNWYSQNNTYINGQGGLVGVGTDGPSHKLHVNSSVNNNTLRLTHNLGVSNAKLNFGDGEYVYLHEHTDDHLWLKANSVTLQGYLYPSGAGSYNCGNGSNYFYTVYADDHDYKGVWGYTFDTYDDLELLDNIQSETYYDAKLGHDVMIMKPESLPKCITNYEDADYDPSSPFISVKKTNGLLIGAIRQLNSESKLRDQRLTERTDILADALGIDYSANSGSVTQTVTDFGTATGNGREISVKFSQDFIAKTPYGTTPVVQITPLGGYGKYYIKDKGHEGFVLVLEDATADFSFDWTAMAKVTREVNAATDHLNDVFHKEPIVSDGSHPTINIPNTLVDPNQKK